MKNSTKIIALILLLSIILSSCEFEVTTAYLADIKTCVNLSDECCNKNDHVFNTDDPQIYVSCKLINAPNNTFVNFVWKYVDGETIIIDDVTLNYSDLGINLDLNSRLSKPYNGWPIGKYEVEISVEGNSNSPEIICFEVR
ncbi:MAG: hypothetical protein HQ521_09410 [Bacteroidetes bacterium]|nr:hypothetical protein [Bacteroidota bacterium]